MKTLLLLLALACSLQSYSQTTAISDANFEQVLIDLGYDNIIDGSVITANISNVTMLDVSSKSISDLSGIEDFTALEILSCYSNQLTSLDVTSNTALLTLDCGVNSIANLDLSQNTALTSLSCFVNQISSLNVSQNTGLYNLHCFSNQLTSLDLSQNTVLINLDCSGNQITGLNLSQNPDLTTVQCQNNELNCLNLKNGANTNLILLAAQVNSNLTCVEVDDVAYSTTNWANIPSGCSYNSDCNNSCSTVGIEELTKSSKQLMKIVDIIGRDTTFKTNTTLIYIYSDGSTEKVFKVEL